MISEKIIHQCITHLVRDAIMANPEEEEVESVCDLVSSIGGKLDQTTTNKTMVNAYFDRMKTLSVNKALVSRIRFKLIDILELRSRNWVAREGQQYLHGGPMTIEEIHRVEEEKQRAARRKTMATTRDRDIGRGSSRRMDDRDRDRRQTRGGAPMGGRPDRERMSGGPHEEFTTVRNPVLMARRAEREAERAALKAAASTAAAPPPARDLLPSKSSNASKDELPTSTSRSSVAAPPASKKSEGRPNAFDVLAQSDEDEHEEGEIVDDEHSASGEIEEDDELTSPTDGADRKKDIKTADELDKYVQRNLANDFMVACEYGVPECVDVLLKLRSFVQDEKMEDITQTALAKLVEELSKDARKIKGGLGTESAESVTARRKVECLGNVAVWFCRQQLLSTERFTEYLKENISILTELVLDCPGVDTCLAVVSGACLVDGLLSMSFLRQCIVELADVAGDFTPRVMRKPGFPFKLMPPAPASFIATVLETVRSMDERGEEAVREAWAGYVVEEEGRDSREDLTAVLEQTDMSMIKFPW